MHVCTYMQSCICSNCLHLSPAHALID